MADVTRLHKLVRKAKGLQDFQRASLNASGTGVVGRPVVLVDNPAGNAMPIKLSRHEQARWTCAHHQYLGAGGHQVFSRSCQSCRSLHHQTITLALPGLGTTYFHACCGVARNVCCDVSAFEAAAFSPSVAPPTPANPAMACTS